MAQLLFGAALFLVSEGPGRGEDPSDAGGVLLVVGIALLSVIIAIAAVYLVIRLYQRRREANRGARTVERPIPAEEGRPWSSER